MQGISGLGCTVRPPPPDTLSVIPYKTGLSGSFQDLSGQTKKIVPLKSDERPPDNGFNGSDPAA
jgi:hypothetical protein